MYSNKKTKLIALASVVCIAGVMVFFGYTKWVGQSDQKAAILNFQDLANPESTQKNSPDSPPSGVAEDSKDFFYKDPAIGYSLRIPFKFEAETYNEKGGGQTVVFQEKTGMRAFQIFSESFDEKGPLTPERIHKDVPDLKIENSQNVIIGEEKIPALIFKSKKEETGESREVWFVDHNMLFQILAPLNFDNELAEIMRTWRSE